MTPIFFSLLRVMAASTSGMALMIGRGEIARSSLTQKWPPMEVTAAASAPAAFIRCTSRAKILRLPAGILVVEVAAHFADVGVGDRELQRNAGGHVPLDQAAIVEVGGGRADAADESDMHGSDCRLWRPVRQRMGRAPQAAALTSRKDTRRRCVSSHSTRRTQRKLSSSVSRPTVRSSGWSRSTRGSR